MNIYLREIRANLKAIIIWCTSVALLIAMGMSEFSSVKGTTSMSEMLNSFPDSLKAIMGGGAFNPDTALGYFSVLYLYIVLIVTIHAAMLGAGIISKEESDKTVEFLMTKPVSRYRIITAKMLASLTNILILNIVTLLASFALFGTQSDEPIYDDLFTLMLGMFLLQLLFLALGAFLAGLRNNAKFAIGVATGILLTTFFLSIVVDINKKIKFIKYFTPFKYFDAKTLLIDDGFNPLLVIMTLAITAGLTYLTYLFYDRRDLGH